MPASSASVSEFGIEIGSVKSGGHSMPGNLSNMGTFVGLVYDSLSAT